MNPLLRLANLDRLPITIRVHAKAASGPTGSLAALERILRFLPTMSSESLQNLIPLLYNILDPDYADLSTFFEAPKPNYTLVHRAALALEIMYQNPIVNSAIEAAPDIWERVWPWVHFLYQFRDMLGSNLPAAPFISAVLVGAMARLTEHSRELREKIMETPGALAVVAGCWPHILQIENPTERMLPCVMVAVFIKDERITRQPYLNDIVHATGGSVWHFSQVVMKQIQVLDLPQNSADEKTIRQFTIMAHLSSYFDRDAPSDNSPPLSLYTQALLKHGFS
ncbi:MYND-type domain-containing protein [Mycena indigotica]|uniref:MYND-type domain-containing protein n=1 Tax=Mycena indigotica TaxID=2126181 RepID=A0A8H6SWZ7_9AGAR|nr:MYND-type domain-containing protein [Mycena indigotica]KAF7306221.1 MYND-type domain-containing protein [Mycena indigotica]